MLAGRCLIHRQVWFSVVESRMTEDCLHFRHVSRCSQHLRRERVPAAVGRTLLDTGLTVEPGDRLLQSYSIS